MLGDSSSVLATTTTTSGGVEAPPSITVGAHDGSSEVGHVGSNSGEEGDRSFGGKRWPRQEALALLKIRSDMDAAFREASVKAPLWDEVSGKLAELGYNRSAKKCKEKFENVFKYHKRTKESRTGKQEGKTYRFFDQLEAFENHPSSPVPPPSKPQAPVVATTIAMPLANLPPSSVVGASHITPTVPSTTTTTTTTTTTNVPQGIGQPVINLTVPSLPPPNPTIPSQSNIQSSFPNFSSDLFSNSTSSSSTSSDMDLQGRHKRRRHWKNFFDRLMTQVVQKQEEMQKKFLDAIEKREHERMVREESWRTQEMARINREREILAQERSIAAAKDAAVMAFLQKLAEQQSPGQVQNNPPSSQPPPPPAPAPPQPAPIPTPTPTTTPIQIPLVPVAVTRTTTSVVDMTKSDNGDQNFMGASSSRWPKVEIEALIRLRTELDFKYQQNGPKGPLWEDISAEMRKLGYNRNAKRCKEKWENINKYFKKVKESNKKRPEDSKTCPYFHQLDALYKEKNKIDMSGGASSSINQLKPENSVPLMVRPEQQWPPPPPQQDQQHRPDSAMEGLESDQDNPDDKDDDDDDDEADGYEIVANKPASANTGE